MNHQKNKLHDLLPQTREIINSPPGNIENDQHFFLDKLFCYLFYTLHQLVTDGGQKHGEKESQNRNLLAKLPDPAMFRNVGTPNGDRSTLK